MNKKRVGVITFHDYDNYGAILQSYALQRKLKEMGTYPEIIDYRCDYISNPFRLVNLKKKGLFNYIYGAIGHIWLYPKTEAVQPIPEAHALQPAGFQRQYGCCGRQIRYLHCRQ